MERATLSLIVPMYNEAPNLDMLVATCQRVLDATETNWELLLIDDGSTDSSAQIVEERWARELRLRYYRHPHRQGKTAALATGFDHADGNYLFTLDADLQEDPEAIPRMLERLQAGVGMVVGWRRVRRDSWFKRVASRVFNAGVRWGTGLPLHDINCGFKGMRREVAQALRPWLVREFHRYLPLIAHRLGYTVEELEVRHRPRAHGRSRYGFERYWRAIADGVVLWRALKELKPPR